MIRIRTLIMAFGVAAISLLAAQTCRAVPWAALPASDLNLGGLNDAFQASDSALLPGLPSSHQDHAPCQLPGTPTHLFDTRIEGATALNRPERSECVLEGQAACDHFKTIDSQLAFNFVYQQPQRDFSRFLGEENLTSECGTRSGLVDVSSRNTMSSDAVRCQDLLSALNLDAVSATPKARLGAMNNLFSEVDRNTSVASFMGHVGQVSEIAVGMGYQTEGQYGETLGDNYLSSAEARYAADYVPEMLESLADVYSRALQPRGSSQPDTSALALVGFGSLGFGFVFTPFVRVCSLANLIDSSPNRKRKKLTNSLPLKKLCLSARAA